MIIRGFLLLVIKFIFSEATICTRYGLPRDVDLKTIKGTWQIKQTLFHQNISHQNVSQNSIIKEQYCHNVQIEKDGDGLNFTWTGHNPRVTYKGKLGDPINPSIWEVNGPFREGKYNLLKNLLMENIQSHPEDLTSGLFHVFVKDDNNILLIVCFQTNPKISFTELLTRENFKSDWDSLESDKELDENFFGKFNGLEKFLVRKTCNKSAIPIASFLLLQFLFIAEWKISL